MKIKGSSLVLLSYISLTLCLPAVVLAPVAAAGTTRTVTAPTDLRESLAWYSDKGTGIMFVYPKAFIAQHHPQSDVAVKLSGATESGANGEIELTIGDEAVNVETLGRMVAEAFQKQMPSYAPGALEWVRFGRNYKLNGVTRLANLKVGESRFNQRVTHWASNGKVYTLSMLGPESQWTKLDPLYNYILLSVAPFGAGSGPALSAPHGEAGNKLPTGFSSWSKRGFGSFSYPASWHVEPEMDPNVVVKMSGTDSSGRGGAIQLAHGTAWDGMPLSQFADTIEKTYLKPHTNYARLTDGTATFGAGTRVEALRRSGSMQVNGVDAMSHTAFWTEGGKHYCLSMNTMGYTRGESESLFNKTLQTLTLESNPSSPAD